MHRALCVKPSMPAAPSKVSRVHCSCSQVVTPAGMEPDDRDWRAKQPAAAPAEGSAATAAAPAAAGGDGRWQQDTGGQAGKAREPPRMNPPQGASNGVAAGTSAPTSEGRQYAPNQAPQAAQVCHAPVLYASCQCGLPPITFMETITMPCCSWLVSQTTSTCIKPQGLSWLL